MADAVKIKDSLGRELEISEPTIEQQLDLMEALGESTSNPGYVNFASMIYLVKSIDGTPLPRVTKKEHFRRNAGLIKNEGMEAIIKYVKGKSEDVTDEIATAKN
ncbi:MAG TPA: hypothetical protein PK231_03000 [Acidocella sp.]|nr:hypothetical protein [Acidocella sp.]